ncbi:MAG: class I mannose-6-phosphate isomerase [Chloroflexi bacterium]|nr:class I mannose-6-phosphate isomerase [Chloroflexota bacterium]
MDTPNTSTRLLAPRLVGRVWGGDRLRALAPDAAPSGPIGEAWFGDADEQPGGVLVKLLDVQDRLSVQVHPDDDLAKVMHGAGAIGKHEAWVVLEAAAAAELLLGRSPSVSSSDITNALASGADITPLLARHAARRGDVFDVPTGCLHALMPGLFIWEVQQRSDRTYRVADWGRNDPSRPLHAREAIRATDAAHQATRTTAIDWGKPGEQLLVASPHFSARAVVGPWAGEIAVGSHGATATAIGSAAVGGVRLVNLATAHLATGLQSIDLAAGAALLIAEGR